MPHKLNKEPAKTSTKKFLSVEELMEKELKYFLRKKGIAYAWIEDDYLAIYSEPMKTNVSGNWVQHTKEEIKEIYNQTPGYKRGIILNQKTKISLEFFLNV